MQALSIILDLNDGAWADLGTIEEGLFSEGTLAGVGALPNGTSGGRPSVLLRVELPDGTTVVAGTTMRLFLNAAKAFEARYPGVLDGDA